MSAIGSRYDVTIIGGGHNGLVAACYLARAGLSILVLERNAELGGATRSARVFEGMDAKLSVYSYLVSLFPGKIVDDLDLNLRLKSRSTASWTPALDNGKLRELLLLNNAPDDNREAFLALTGDEREYRGFLELQEMQEQLAAVIWPSLTAPLVSREEMRSRLDRDGEGIVNFCWLLETERFISRLDQNMNFHLFSLTVFAAASLTLAQSPEGSNPGGRFFPPLDPLTFSLDANGDGELSAEEITQAPEALKTLDRNKDGRLTADEIFPRPPGGFPGFGRPGGMGPMGPNRPEQKLADKFDADKNGYLDPAERQLALKAVQSGGRPGGPPGRRPRGGQAQGGTPGPKVSPKDVKVFPKAGLYDPTVLRTVFIEFDTETWEDEMAKFKDTDVEMPATVTVDGKKFPMVGVKFRGQSSFGHVPAGSKRSLNLSMDFVHREQRLYGYKTLNLLNCMGDPSFLSSILYSHLAADYLPVPKANMMKVVINGESWGVYSNVQQYNKDFLKEFYGTTAGARWKVPGSPQADGGLRFLGEGIDPYRQRFEIKSKDKDASWKALINLCKVLNETPAKDLPEAIEPILNVDGVLRFLAIDVAVVNSDGYWTRASDYSIYLNPDGVFHILPHDMNEAFRGGGRPGGGLPGGPPPQFDAPGGGRDPDSPPPHPIEAAIDRNRDGELSRDEIKNITQALTALDRNKNGQIDPEELRPQFEFGPTGGGFGRPGRRGGFGRPGGGGGHGDATLDPLVGLDSERMPLRSKLLAVPQYRARYLQLLRTIAEKSLTHKNLSPVIARYRELIADEVKNDTRKTSSYDAFANATAPLKETEVPPTGSLNDFIEQRRSFLLKHGEIKK